jgi:hypothetical protein
MAQQEYEYDLFISYSRKGTCRTWVTQMLLKNLVDILNDELPNQVSYFIDEEIEPGVPWEDRIRDKLLVSKVALCIWSPTYFQSDWCMAEWKSMERRQDLLTHVRPEFADSPVLFPVIYSNGDYFPPDAKGTQYSRMFIEDPELLNHVEAFKLSVKYAELVNRTRALAKQLAPRIVNAPPFQSGWPWVRPEVKDAPRIDKPTL